MNSPTSNGRKIKASAALLNRACENAEWFSVLAAEGFGDLNRQCLLIFIAASLKCGTPAEMARALGISTRAFNQAIEVLISRGYLKLEENPNDSELAVAPTEFGSTVGSIILLVLGEAAEAGCWADFQFRPGDIVISTPSKSGTTWMQMICALLIFQSPDLPAPLGELSPWLEKEYQSQRDEIYSRLNAQSHRRFIKTHVRLSRIPVDSRVTYVEVARNPLDAAVSLYFYRVNASKGRTQEDTKRTLNRGPREWLLDWINSDRRHSNCMHSFIGHISDAWERRLQPNTVLLHYEDLCTNLESQMRLIATRLDISVPDDIWPDLVKAATFEEMRAAADLIQPSERLDDSRAFFRKGGSGSGSELLTDTEIARYHQRVARLAPADLLAWLHRA